MFRHNIDNKLTAVKSSIMFLGLVFFIILPWIVGFYDIYINWLFIS